MTEFHGFPRFDAPRVGRVSVEEEATQTDDVPAPVAQLAQLRQDWQDSTTSSGRKRPFTNNKWL